MRVHEAKIPCKICGNFLKPSNMQFHMKTVHSTIKSFNCEICPKSFKTFYELKMHLATHDKKHKCHLCKSKFAQKGQLNEHLIVHENPDIYKCKICSRRFVRKPNLTEHMKIHDPARVKIFQCDLCDYTSYERRSMELHMNGHLNKLKKINEKNYLKCKFCWSVLRNEFVMRSHLIKRHEMKLSLGEVRDWSKSIKKGTK